MNVESFEQYAARHGAGYNNYGDAGLHVRGPHVSEKAWKRKVAAQVKKDDALSERRKELRALYEAEVVAGRIRPPTNDELLSQRATGEGFAAEAARNVLAKRESRRLASNPLD